MSTEQSDRVSWRGEARTRLDAARVALEANARKQYDPVFGISTAVIEDARAYLDALDAVLALHADAGAGWCITCEETRLPCPTVRAIEGEPT